MARRSALGTRSYSPYQLNRIWARREGLHGIRAAGTLLSGRTRLLTGPPCPAGWTRAGGKRANNYDLPYRLHQGGKRWSQLVGAGSGKEVEERLRSGEAHVDGGWKSTCNPSAGRAYHPEQPYRDPRVHAILEMRALLSKRLR